MTVTVFTKPHCPQCDATKRQLTKLGVPFETVDLTQNPSTLEQLQAAGLPMFAAMPFFSGYTTGNLLNVLYICVFVTAGGYACYFMGMEATSAMQGSLVFFFKPVLAPILAMLILGEEIPWNMWAGIGLMLVASVVSMIPTWETLLSVRPFII